MKFIIPTMLLIFAMTALSPSKISSSYICDHRDLNTADMIYCASIEFAQDPSLISKISWCESKHKISSHDGGRGVNMTGIHDATFERWNNEFEKEYGYRLDRKSTFDQFRMMAYAFSKGESYRDDWTTYVAYMRPDHTYSFYSTLLEGYYTVVCK